MKKNITKNSTTPKKTIIIICMAIILLTACFIVAYYYFNKQNTSSAELTTQSEITADASSALTVLKSYYSQNGSYPTANNCTNPTTSEVCLVSDKNNITYGYTASINDNYKTYRLEVINKNSDVDYVLSTTKAVTNN